MPDHPACSLVTVSWYPGFYSDNDYTTTLPTSLKQPKYRSISKLCSPRNIKNAIFKVCTAVQMQSQISCDMMMLKLANSYKHFKSTFCLHLQCRQRTVKYSRTMPYKNLKSLQHKITFINSGLFGYSSTKRGN
jgi:hypothetical protein